MTKCRKGIIIVENISPTTKQEIGSAIFYVKNVLISLLNIQLSVNYSKIN